MRPLIIGHRGAPAYLPEHTESSYRLAIRQGADLLEPDVVPSRDGVLVVRHEPDLASTTDIALRSVFASRGRASHNTAQAGDQSGDQKASREWLAEDLDWAEIQQLRAVERIPDLRPASAAHSGEEPVLRLRELVRIVEEESNACGRHCGLVIELKHDARCLAGGLDFVDLLARELDGLWGLDCLRDLRVESFEAPALDRLRAAGMPGKRILLVAAGEEVLPGEEGPERLTDAGLNDAAERYDGISVRTSLLGVDEDGSDQSGAALVAAAHARGLEVFTYTLRAEDEFLPPTYRGRPEDYWRAIIETGVDGVFADAPDRVRELLETDRS